ncbi:unnamed protein product [Cladocopium goreaui]|uniref:Mitochondrial import inner membrane translocase subunit TIM22 n=1 Tax=Cladocopium goreaui TaxID=2562237 RepID=A0A9P1CL41_9DINO|nr:unnamed protein product [Cladocopium goreaui]
MDDWMRYQITGDERYIYAFRRQRAVRAAFMGGSLGAIGCVSASIMTSQVFAKEWPPPGLPKRCAGFSVFFGLASAAISWIGSQHLVGQLSLPQMEGVAEEAKKAASKMDRDRTI